MIRLSDPIGFAHETSAATPEFATLDDDTLESFVETARDNDAGVEAGEYSAEEFEDWLDGYRVALFKARDAAREEEAGWRDERSRLVEGDEPSQTPMAWTLGHAYTCGTKLVSWRSDGGFVAVLAGVGPEGHGFESDDFGPCPTREEAEERALAWMREEATLAAEPADEA